MGTGWIKQLLHRREGRRQTLVALALVALRNRSDAERMRRARGSIAALYEERGRELQRLYRRLDELGRSPRSVVRAAGGEMRHE